jgi:hypothetical protein
VEVETNSLLRILQLIAIEAIAIFFEVTDLNAMLVLKRYQCTNCDFSHVFLYTGFTVGYVGVVRESMI